MKKRIVVSIVALVFGAAGYALAAGFSVTLSATGPQPPTVEVNWGDTVTFANGDSTEHVVSIPREEFASPSIPPGGALEYVFDGRAGNYNVIQLGKRNFSGRIAVKVSGSLTLKSGLEVVPFGKTLTLSGQSAYPGSPVLVRGRDAGSTGEWKTVLEVTAGADGSYSGRIRPIIGARYQARAAADQIASKIVDVAVRPTVSIGLSRRTAPAGSTILVQGRVLPGRAVERADLTGYDTRRKRWVPLASRSVGASGKVSFKLKVEEGSTRLRISIRRGSVQSGYTTAESRIVRVLGTTKK